MIKFKKGDRVVCTGSNNYVLVGKRGVVMENSICPCVDWDNGYGRWAVHENNMELEGHVTLYTPKYTLGQELHTEAGAWRALLNGQKICRPSWGPDEFIRLVDDRLVDESGDSFSDTLINYVIYTPPKRKIKSERWFAVWSGLYQTADKNMWSEAYESEAAVRRQYPGPGMTYVRAECEVEAEA